MFQLILVIISIALTAAIVLVSINYLNPEVKQAKEIGQRIAMELQDVEQVYDNAVNLSEGVPPPVTLDADGGFQSVFLPVLKFKPKLVPGYNISYGKLPSLPSIYSELNYVCIYPENTSKYSSVVGRALFNTKNEFAEGQALLVSSCADPLNTQTANLSTPPSLVVFLRSIPKYQ